MPENKENPFTKLRESLEEAEATENPFTAIRLEQEAIPDAGVSGLLAAGTSLTNAVLGAPGNTLAAGTALLRGGADKLFGGEFGFGEKFEEERGKFPANIRPTIEGIGAGVRSVPGLFGSQPIGERYDEELAGIEADQAAMREAHPVATGIGDVAGDVGALFATRNAAGIPGKMQRLEDLIMTGGKKPDFVFGAINNLDKVKPGAWKFVGDKLLQSNSWRNLLKATGRAGEAGLEAVALEILNGDDPSDLAAYAAGSQLVGSLGLQTLKSTWGSGGAAKGASRLGAAGLVGAGIWQYIQQAAPGGDNSPLDSVRVGFEKVMLAMTAGAITGLMGAGRMRGPGTEQLRASMPRIADAMTAIPRASMLSMLENMIDAEPEQQQQAVAALEVMGTRTDELSEEMIEGIESALGSGDFVTGIDSLIQESQEFADLIFSTAPPSLSNGN